MPKVTGTRQLIFPRKRNMDGTINSMCGVCFSNVASADNEADLQKAEDAHVCEGLNFAHVLRPMDHN